MPKPRSGSSSDPLGLLPLTEDDARFLLSDLGEALLAQVAALPGDPPARLLKLRRQLPDLSPTRAAAAVAVVDARARATRRGLPGADTLLAEPDSLAQATSPAIAAFHARRLTGSGTVLDLCCGIGMDAVAMAAAGLNVHAWERDPARAAFAAANAARRGVADRVTVTAAEVPVPPPATGALFYDPARRDDAGRASHAPDRWSPPLSLWNAARADGRTAVAKLSPALADRELEALGDAVAFLSEERECKEACVLCGRAAAGMPARAAVLLPEEIVLAAGEPAPVAPRIGTLLLDPDPAVVRAAALGEACRRLDAARVSPDDAYLTTDTPPTPHNARIATAWRVQEAMPWQAGRVADWLRARGVGRLILKKRRFPYELDALSRRLRLRGATTATLVMVADGDGFLAVLCDPAPLPTVQ